LTRILLVGQSRSIEFEDVHQHWMAVIFTHGITHSGPPTVSQDAAIGALLDKVKGLEASIPRS
jgi:hypothetical protein